MCFCKYCDFLPQSKKSYVVLPPEVPLDCFGSFVLPRTVLNSDTSCEKNTGSQDASHHWSLSSVGSERSSTSLTHCLAVPGSSLHDELDAAAAFHIARISRSLGHHITYHITSNSFPIKTQITASDSWSHLHRTAASDTVVPSMRSQQPSAKTGSTALHKT